MSNSSRVKSSSGRLKPKSSKKWGVHKSTVKARKPVTDEERKARKLRNSLEAKLVTYYSSILLMLKKYHSLEKVLNEWLDLFIKRNDPLGALNMFRIIACMKHLDKNNEQAIKILDFIYSIYKQLDCKIGMASAAYGSGLMKFKMGNHAGAKAKLKEASIQYQWLNHTIGL